MEVCESPDNMALDMIHLRRMICHTSCFSETPEQSIFDEDEDPSDLSMEGIIVEEKAASKDMRTRAMYERIMYTASIQANRRRG